MGPEMERRSEKLVLGLPAKEKKSMFERSENKVVNTDLMNGKFYTKTVTRANDVVEKQNVNMPLPEGENQDINVTDGVNLGGGGNGNETEESSGSLSSFNDTVSDGDAGLGISDDEINSEFHGRCQATWDYPGFEESFRTRKKKVTKHWRNFIRPITWRCKWAELQMRKFQIKASMYSKLLEEFDRARKAQKENFCVEGQCSRTVPFPYQMKSRKIMRRTKRKRVEDTTDVANYMSQHNLFGYCENKGTSTDYANMTHGFANPVIPAVRNDYVDLIGNDEDMVQFDDEETSLEQILSKINSMESLVHNLTSRVDKVISENHEKFSSLDKMHLLTTPSDSGNPKTPPSDEDNTFTTSPTMTTQPASKHHIGEACMPVVPLTASLPEVLEGADHPNPTVGYKSDNAEDKTQLKARPIAENKLLVYTRAKKRKIASENQSISSSSVHQTQNERSSVFVASRITALRNTQKKRGKRKRVSSGTKTSRVS